METEINYTRIYGKSKLKISYSSDSGYDKLATGTISGETNTHLHIYTVMNENVVIRKDLIGNVKDVVDGGVNNVKQNI